MAKPRAAYLLPDASRDQRSNQRQQVWYGGYFDGCSRQRAPVCSIQRTPSTTGRRSWGGRPRPSARRRGVTIGAINDHCSFVSLIPTVKQEWRRCLPQQICRARIATAPGAVSETPLGYRGYLSVHAGQDKFTPPHTFNKIRRHDVTVAWKVAPCLEGLLAQLNQYAPRRSRESDGSIGDAAHASRSSDHNPWWEHDGQHYVTARDFTHDRVGGLDCARLAAALELGRDERVKYVIWDHQIMSGADGPSPWTWRPYKGANAHTHHLHLSVVADTRALSETPWELRGLATAGIDVLRPGSRGVAVERLQRILNTIYPHEVNLVVDGIFGPATEAAVKYAEGHGLNRSLLSFILRSWAFVSPGHM